MKKFLPALCALLIAPRGLLAGENAVESSWWDAWKTSLGQTWDSDRYAVMVPFNTYHWRSTYDRDRIKKFNEMPWGLGVERYFIDERDNRHSLYALVFSESYSQAQPTLGYAWEKSYFLDNARDWRAGLGFNAMLTARSKNHYIPFPGATPTLSVNYKFLSVQTTWVPYLGHNDGNVFLTMFKVGI